MILNVILYQKKQDTCRRMYLKLMHFKIQSYYIFS